MYDDLILSKKYNKRTRSFTILKGINRILILYCNFINSIQTCYNEIIHLFGSIQTMKSNTDDAVAKLETDCLPENQIKSPPIPTQDCIDAETLILNDKAELENNTYT